MTIALRNDSATNVGSTRQSSLTVPIPSGTQAGDVMVAMVTTNSATGTISTPSGWTQDASSPALSTQGGVCSCFYKVATGSDTDPTFNFNATRSANGWIGSYSGVDNVTPRDTSSFVANPSASASGVIPSITIATAGEMVVTGTSWSSGAGLVGTFTPPSGFTEEADQCTTIGSATENAEGVSDKLFSSAGATGTMTVTMTTGGSGGAIAAIAIALNPASATSVVCTVINGTLAQLVNVNAGGTDVDAMSYKETVTLTSDEAAALASAPGVFVTGPTTEQRRRSLKRVIRDASG